MCYSKATLINPIDSKVQKSDVTRKILSYLIFDPFTINELMEVKNCPLRIPLNVYLYDKIMEFLQKVMLVGLTFVIYWSLSRYGKWIEKS